MRTKEQGTHLTLNEHDDDDNDDKYTKFSSYLTENISSLLQKTKQSMRFKEIIADHGTNDASPRLRETIWLLHVKVGV